MVTDRAIAGSCLCGATAYALSSPYDRLEVCHCIQCRRANGSAFHMVVPVTEEQVEWQRRDRISEYESSPGKVRAFCSGCGAPSTVAVIAAPDASVCAPG